MSRDFEWCPKCDDHVVDDCFHYEQGLCFGCLQYDVIQEDCLDFYPNGVELIYADPPFNTGEVQWGRNGQYYDNIDDYRRWLYLRTSHLADCMSDNGQLFLHLDYRSVHEAKVDIDARTSLHFMGEIIWSYDYGGRSKKRWPTKHDTILWYAKDPDNYTFNYDAIDRIPYMAPSLCGPEKAARGKVPTDVWWGTIEHTQSPYRTGYPTQKPLWLLERIIKVHSNPGDLVYDPFCGSGTTGHAALQLGRKFVGVDINPQACEIAEKRLQNVIKAL